MLLKCFRLIRVFRFARERKKTVKYSSEILSGIERLLCFLLLLFIICHIISCLWYLVARLEAFGPDTWVSRYSYVDRSPVDVKKNQ